MNGASTQMRKFQAERTRSNFLRFSFDLFEGFISMVQVSFVTTNIPTTGAYRANVSCLFEYSEKKEEHFDVTNVTFSKQILGPPTLQHIECSSPEHLTTKATERPWPGVDTKVVKGRSKVSLVYSSSGDYTARLTVISSVLSTTSLHFVACSTLNRCDECIRDYPVCVWGMRTGTCHSKGKNSNNSHTITCPPVPPMIITSTSRKEEKRLNVFHIHPRSNGFQKTFDVTLMVENEDFIQHISQLRVRVGNERCLLTWNTGDRVIYCRLRNVTSLGRAIVEVLFNNGTVPCTECIFTFSQTEYVTVENADSHFDAGTIIGLIIFFVVVTPPLTFLALSMWKKAQDEKKWRRASRQRITDMLLPQRELLHRSQSNDPLETSLLTSLL